MVPDEGTQEFEALLKREAAMEDACLRLQDIIHILEYGSIVKSVEQANTKQLSNKYDRALAKMKGLHDSFARKRSALEGYINGR